MIDLIGSSDLLFQTSSSSTETSNIYYIKPMLLVVVYKYKSSKFESS